MWTELHEIWKSFWTWFTGLSKKGMAVVCISGSVIASMGFAIWLLIRIYSGDGNSNIQAKLTDLRKEQTYRDSMNMVTVKRNFDEIRTDIAVFRKEQSANDSMIYNDLYDITIITAANSNSDLLRRLVPHLESVATKEDIYRFVLALEKSESARRFPDSIRIGINKVKHP